MKLLFNDDSISIMDRMNNKDFKVDMIATDPPYSVTSRGCNGNSGGMFAKDINKKGKVFEHNNTPITVWAEKLFKLLKDGGHCYIMTNHKNLQEYINTLTGVGFHFIKSLIWDKGNKIMGGYYMSQFEYILFLRKGSGVRINNCGTSDIISINNKKQKDENGKNLHDTEKPVDLMKILIGNSTKEGEIVFDPFMGIGATPLAALELNRNYIGVELDKNYFDIAKKRIDDYSM